MIYNINGYIWRKINNTHTHTHIYIYIYIYKIWFYFATNTLTMAIHNNRKIIFIQGITCEHFNIYETIQTKNNIHIFLLIKVYDFFFVFHTIRITISSIERNNLNVF